MARVDYLRCDDDSGSKSILLVLGSAPGSYCVLADRILGQRQPVIKALPSHLGSVPGLSGCSILSDGGIALVVDPERLDHSALAGVASRETRPAPQYEHRAEA